MADEQSYQSAIKEASSAAWDQDWTRAIKAYTQALQVKPNDPQAMTGLGLSLLETGKYAESLEIYERVSQLVPGDPLAHEKMASIFELTGKQGEAAAEYLRVGELYYARKDIDSAVLNWKRAAQLNADLPKPHMRLAVFYERSPETINEAMVEYIETARLFQEYEQISKAEQTLQRAMKMDPTNLDVRNALADLKRGISIQRSSQYEMPEESVGPQPVQQAGDDDLDIDTEERGRPPADEGARHAMGLLAEIVWSGEVPPRALDPLLKAIDLHQLGDIGGAIASYSAAFQAGLDHPALRINLGLLYYHASQFRDSISLLSGAAQSPDYAIAANQTLALAHLAMSNMTKAAEHAVFALRDIDRQLNGGQTDQAGYDRLLGGLANRSGDELRDIARAITTYMDDPNWRKKFLAAFAGYAEQGKDSYVSDLMELIIEGGRPVLAEIMNRVQHYIDGEKLDLAHHEIHYALEKSPDFLPAHRAIADILVKTGKAQDAAVKLNFVAETYLIRGNADKAADLFSEAVEIWPADLDARRRVLAMLKQQGRVDEAVKQYADLADLYYTLMADQQAATKIYNEGLEYARTNKRMTSPQVVSILRALADLSAQQLDWRQAIQYYDQILKIAPDDEPTALALVDLHFQMGETPKAMSELDKFMRNMVTRGQVDKVISTLEEQVRRYPNQLPLRQRLAQVYEHQGRIPDAIAQMDTIGELLLDAGNYAGAADTIRKIIAFNPPDIEQYRQLLQQVEEQVTNSAAGGS